MRHKLILVLAFFLLGFAFVCEAAEKKDTNVFTKSWLPEFTQCNVDSDCKVIQYGCYYWQPINPRFVDRVPPYYTCKKTVEPGSIPNVGCVERVCQKVEGQGSEANVAIPTTGSVSNIKKH